MSIRFSPSIASSDILNVAREVRFVNNYFDDIHLDVADGAAVNEISFGFKMCGKVCEIAKLPISLHLEVMDPLRYMEQVKKGRFDQVFIQIDCLPDTERVIRTYQRNGISVGINLSNLDLKRTNLEEILDMTEHILVNTTYHNDPRQILRNDMLEYAVGLSNRKEHKVWIDGAIDWKTAESLKSSNIYTIVMGRAVFEDRDKAIRGLNHLRKLQ